MRGAVRYNQSAKFCLPTRGASSRHRRALSISDQPVETHSQRIERHRATSGQRSSISRPLFAFQPRQGRPSNAGGCCSSPDDRLGGWNMNQSSSPVSMDGTAIRLARAPQRSVPWYRRATMATWRRLRRSRGGAPLWCGSKVRHGAIQNHQQVEGWNTISPANAGAGNALAAIVTSSRPAAAVAAPSPVDVDFRRERFWPVPATRIGGS